MRCILNYLTPPTFLQPCTLLPFSLKSNSTISRLLCEGHSAVASSYAFADAGRRRPHLPLTLWLRPCLYSSDMMDLMCPLWMMLRASGLSIKMQCRTSRMPTQTQIHQLVNMHGRQRRRARGHSSMRHAVSLGLREELGRRMVGVGGSEGSQRCDFTHRAVARRNKCLRVASCVPEEDSSLSSLLTSQSRLLENCVQLFLFPLISAAAGARRQEREAGLVCWRREKTKFFFFFFL